MEYMQKGTFSLAQEPGARNVLLNQPLDKWSIQQLQL